MTFSNTASARLERANERMKVWVEALPEELKPEADSALEHLIQTAKLEITEAYGDGYRIRRDETVCRDHLGRK